MTTKSLFAGLIGLTLLASQAFSQTWTQLTNAPMLNWTAAAASINGSNILVGNSVPSDLFGTTRGKLYLSYDAGNTWTNRSLPGAAWSAMTVSTNGQVMGAAGMNGRIYVSKDAGTNWTLSAAAKNNWSTLASSKDGSTIFATYKRTADAAFCVTTNYGTNWVNQEAPAPVPFTAAVISPDGSNILAAYARGMYLTTNASAWAKLSVPTNAWTCLAAAQAPGYTNVSSLVVTNGTGTNAVVSTNYTTNTWTIFTNLYAGCVPGQVYASTNSGSTWGVLTNSPTNAVSISCSLNGTVVAAAQKLGSVYVSLDSGATWTSAGTNLPTTYWKSIQVSGTGSNFVAVSGTGSSHNSVGVIYRGTR